MYSYHITYWQEIFQLPGESSSPQKIDYKLAQDFGLVSASNYSEAIHKLFADYYNEDQVEAIELHYLNDTEGILELNSELIDKISDYCKENIC